MATENTNETITGIKEPRNIETENTNETITEDVLENDERFVTFQGCIETNQICKDDISSTSKILQEDLKISTDDISSATKPLQEQSGASASAKTDDSTSAKPATREKDPRYSLKQSLDKSETITLMRNDFDIWATKLTRPGYLEVRRDVERSLDEMGEVSDVSLSDLFLRMAAKSGMKMTPSAVQAVDDKKDPEKAQRLYLESQGVKNKVDQLKVDGGLYLAWDSKVQQMNSSPH